MEPFDLHVEQITFSDSSPQLCDCSTSEHGQYDVVHYDYDASYHELLSPPDAQILSGNAVDNISESYFPTESGSSRSPTLISASYLPANSRSYPWTQESVSLTDHHTLSSDIVHYDYYSFNSEAARPVRSTSFLTTDTVTCASRQTQHLSGTETTAITTLLDTYNSTQHHRRGASKRGRGITHVTKANIDPIPVTVADSCGSITGVRSAVSDCEVALHANVSDIIQISANAKLLKSLSHHQRANRMSSSTGEITRRSGKAHDMSGAEGDVTPRDGSPSSFETVAEALHLQWSVIGDKGLKPASADAIAEAIAEAQAKIQTSTRHMDTVNLTAPMMSVRSDTEQVMSPSSHADLPADTVLGTTEAQHLAIQDVRRVSVKVSSRSVESLASDSASEHGSSSAEPAMLDTEAFLRSLPPIKPFNMSDFSFTDVIRSPSSSVVTGTERMGHAASQATSDMPVTGTPAKNKTIIASPRKLVNADTDRLVQSLLSGTLQQQSLVMMTSSHAGHGRYAQSGGHDDHTQTTDSYQLAKDKAKLTGQIEVLAKRTESIQQEKAQLHAELSALQQRLSAFESSAAASPEKQSLLNEIETLKMKRFHTEQAMLDLQKLFEEKLEEIKHLTEELEISQGMAEKLNSKLKELRDEFRSREMTIQALKNKVAELYIEVQTALQSKLQAETDARCAKNDVTTLVSSKQWYQQQLQLAHEARSELQKQLTLLHAESTSHGKIVQRLKTENTRIRQQLSEAQQRALHEKENLARHLEMIERDMTERESVFHQVNQEKSKMEGAIRARLSSVAEETDKLSMAVSQVADLQVQLELAQNNLSKKQAHISSLETDSSDMLKRLTRADETISERDKTTEDLQHQLIKMDTDLKALQTDFLTKDQMIFKLEEEKSCNEIALNAALTEKRSVDYALETLRHDMCKLDITFRQLKTELQNLQEEKTRLECELDERAQKTSTDAESASEHASDIELQKVQLEKEILNLRAQLEGMQITEQLSLAERDTRERQSREDENLKLELVQLREYKDTSEAKLNTALTPELARHSSQIDHLEQTSQGVVDATVIPNERLDSSAILHDQVHAVQIKHQEGDASVQLEQVQTVIKENVQLKAEISSLKGDTDTDKELCAVKEANDQLKSKLIVMESEKSQTANAAMEQISRFSTDVESFKEESESLRQQLSRAESKAVKDVLKQKARAARLTADLNKLQSELKERQSAFEVHIDQLGSSLHATLLERDRLLVEIESLQRRVEIGAEEQTDVLHTQLQALNKELEELQLQNNDLEAALHKLQQIKAAEIQAFQQQLSALEDDLAQQRASQDKERELSRELSLELELERGRVSGLMQMQNSLQERVSGLEATMIEKDVVLKQSTERLQSLEHEHESIISSHSSGIERLESALQTEQNKHRESRKQIGIKVAEAKKARRQHATLRLEQEQLQNDLENTKQMLIELQANMSRVTDSEKAQRVETDRLQTECYQWQTDVDRYKREAEDSLLQTPAHTRDIKRLTWELQQKSDQVDSLLEQLSLVEERHAVQLQNAHQSLQISQEDCVTLRDELTSIKRDQISVQSHIIELHTALTVAVSYFQQQEQQLENINSAGNDNTGNMSPADMGIDVQALQTLLQNTAALHTHRSRPLDTLQSCLSNLRTQISGLQRQVHDHTTTVHTTKQSWRGLEAQVHDLNDVIKTVCNSASVTSQTTIAAIAALESDDEDVEMKNRHNLPDMIHV